MQMRIIPTALATPRSPMALAAGASSKMKLPEQVDYLVVGGGATAMAFCDTLLRHAAAPTSVAMIDEHSRPGGQWMDSYGFVQLHQPSDMYGVESFKLEPHGYDDDLEPHRATRSEIVDYYDRVCRTLEDRFDFHFIGGTSFNMAQLEIPGDDDSATSHERQIVGHRLYELPEGRSIWARKVVDGRYLQPDLPVHIPPKFQFDSNVIRCLPVNSLLTADRSIKHYVIIGAGKTGMDAIVFLLQQHHVDPDDILWIVSNEAWITARENIGSCMEFLHECTALLQKEQSEGQSTADAMKSSEFFQRGFLEWEKQGKIYRFDTDILPKKFKDATLSKSELALIKMVKRVVRSGRVKSITNDGKLHFSDGTSMPLPWPSATEDNVLGNSLFVHCSAGAFNYSKQTTEPPPIFSRHRISIQDVYGTPGFCFVGSIIGKLESLGTKMSDAEKNAMCLAPIPDAAQTKLPLGPSGGDIGVLSPTHGYVQRLSNLRKWLQVADIRDWMVRNRLFNLRHSTAEEISVLVEETWNVLQSCGIVSGNI